MQLTPVLRTVLLGVAGYTYGTARCVALVTVCQTFGAATAFLFARYFIRPSVESFLRRRFGESFVAMDEAIAKQGFKIVFLIRASPVLPFSVTNYLCGCSLSLDLISFVLATWVGVLPGTTSYCSIGYAGKAVRHMHLVTSDSVPAAAFQTPRHLG
jgi:uncharacterized membrane protein YdjX (TVP38/TMEM64 family)